MDRKRGAENKAMRDEILNDIQRMYGRSPPGSVRQKFRIRETATEIHVINNHGERVVFGKIPGMKKTKRFLVWRQYR